MWVDGCVDAVDGVRCSGRALLKYAASQWTHRQVIIKVFVEIQPFTKPAFQIFSCICFSYIGLLWEVSEECC